MRRSAGSRTRSGPPLKGSASRSEAHPPETIPVRWLVRAFAATVAIALLCGYLTFCVLFFQGQWQLVLHPARPGRPLPAKIGNSTPETVHFDVGGSGEPQLAGVWLPARLDGGYRSLTLLYLPGGDGSLADAATRLAAFDRLGISVFAIDYRGYGQSAARHPSQRSTEADSQAALSYLLTIRHIPPERIVLYGEGVGAYLAARLASEHRSIPAVILDSPRLHLADEVARDARVRLLPVHLLFRERFSLEPVVDHLATPKLILWRNLGRSPDLRAADPRITVTLPPGSEAEFDRALSRFLDQYVARPASEVIAPEAP